jgi:hypothetical protein
MVMIYGQNQASGGFGSIGSNGTAGNQYLNELNRQQAVPAPVDPYAALRAQLAAQRAKFNPNYMQNYQPPPQPTIQGLANNPMVSNYNAMHGYNQQPASVSSGQFMGGTNPLVAAYNAARGYK